MIYAIAVVIVLILDQAVKLWTVSNIALNTGEVPFIDGFLHFTHLHNYGAAFSILQNTRWILVGITVIFVVAVVFLLSTERITSPLGKWSAVMVLAGALGNGIDRVMMGYVVDMFEFEFFSFPVFNVADIFVTVFGILFCVYIVFSKEDHYSEYEPKPEPRKKPSLPKRKPEPKPERTAPSIEDIGKVGVRRPVAPPQPEPTKPAPAPKAEPQDAFAEWETPKTTYAEPVADFKPAKTEIPEFKIPEPVYSAPSASSDSFDLDDILAEFRD